MLLIIQKGKAVAKRSNFYLISHGGQKDPFWDPVRKGMDVAAELLDVDAEYLGPREKEFDADDVFLENLEKALTHVYPF